MSPLHDLFTVRWLRKVMRWYFGSIKSHLRSPAVSFDGERVHVVKGSGEDLGFLWKAVRRIGYRTINTWGDDYFLEFQLVDGKASWIGLGWPGALALSDHVNQLPDSRVDPVRGTLANVTTSDSIIVWPSREAGGSLDDPVPGERAT